MSADDSGLPSARVQYWDFTPPCIYSLRQRPELRLPEHVDSPKSSVAATHVTRARERNSHLQDAVFAAGGRDFVFDDDHSSRSSLAEAIAVPGMAGCVMAVRGVLSEQEAAKVLALAEAAGFEETLGLSTAILVARKCLCDKMFERVQPALPDGAIGLNPRWRVYRYQRGDEFESHVDGSWPGSAVAGEVNAGPPEIIADAHPGEAWSRLSLLVVLGGQFEGGETSFYSAGAQGRDSRNVVASVRVPPGAALIFPQSPPTDMQRPHDWPAWAPVHRGSPVTKGEKVILRSDVLFPLYN